DQACRLCWDTSNRVDAGILPGFLGHIVYQQRSQYGRDTSQAESKASEVPGSRSFDKLGKGDDVSELTWCHVTALKPTQRCAGYAAVRAKQISLENHWNKGGRAALRKSLRKKA